MDFKEDKLYSNRKGRHYDDRTERWLALKNRVTWPSAKKLHHHQKLEEPRTRSHTAFRGNTVLPTPCFRPSDTDVGHLPSKTGKKHFSVVLSHKFVVLGYSSPRKQTQVHMTKCILKRAIHHY